MFLIGQMVIVKYSEEEGYILFKNNISPDLKKIEKIAHAMVFLTFQFVLCFHSYVIIYSSLG